MAGISSHAAGGLENRHKYNGIELDTSLGLNEYEAPLRDLDPQTGRWWQIDPETENQEMWSPYTSNNDNPIFFKDPRGNEGEACCDGLWNAIKKTAGEVKALASGAANAWGSDQVLGAGNKSAEEAGFTGDETAFYNAGQTTGHGAAVITGTAESIVGGGSEVLTSGGSTAVSVPLALHGASTIATAFSKLLSQGSESNPHNSSSAARRDAMRKEGVPTSQQPTKQKQTSGGRVLEYEVPTSGGGTTKKEAQQQLKDQNHGPHWEVGTPKKGGQQDPAGRNRLQNGKSKSFYDK